jgi:carboxyl-terminal processing protease
MSARSRLAVLLVSTPIVAFVVIGGFLGKAAAREDAYQFLRVFEDVVSLVLNNYVEEVDLDRMMDGALRGLSEGLDPDSAYLGPDEVRQLESGAPLPEGEVGLELTRQYYLRVLAARDGSPGARAGLMTGDYIRAIDGRSTRDMSVFEGTRRLRGAPGTKVTLTVLRGNAAEPHTVELVRERPGGPAVTTRVVAPGVGYIRIAVFEPTAANQLEAAARELSRGGATELIIDLRGTAQGNVDAAIAAARLFVAQGTLVLLEGRDEARQTVAATKGDGAITLPVTLLVNGGTAGPAELFAAALSANRRATLVGERTAGRAARQRLVKLPGGGGLWLSTHRYLTAAGTPIHGRGLVPDTEVDDPEVEFGARPSTDPILEKALEAVRAKKAA